jgi:glutathione synthase/RimK-type ligase-like ATP-grasp enzyme
VKWSLEQAGYQVGCWAQLGWDVEQQASICYEEDFHVRLGKYSVEPGDVVWLRRPRSPEFNPRVSVLDAKFAADEYKASFRDLLSLVETLPVRCINKFSAHRFINNKSVQLMLAKTCELNVPPTLIANMPGAVRSFLQTHRPSIGKAFLPHVWQKGDSYQIAATQTFEISPDRLPQDDALTFAPAIFQKMIVKEFDVRTIIMGTAVFSYALHTPSKALDWRGEYHNGLQVTPIPTPLAVEEAMLTFAKRAGIVFGSADFAVDADGKWWFLEINEQGQFLWLDQNNPEAMTLQKFLAFITLPEGASRGEIEERQSAFPSIQDYEASPAFLSTPMEACSNAHLTVEPADVALSHS